MKLTKYTWLNVIILKFVEVFVVVSVPYLVGWIALTIYPLGPHFNVFEIWGGGFVLICGPAVIVVFLGCLIYQNIEWAKHLKRNP